MDLMDSSKEPNYGNDKGTRSSDDTILCLQRCICPVSQGMATVSHNFNPDNKRCAHEDGPMKRQAL